MKYLLDKDHPSILQRQAGKDFSNLSTRMVQYPLSDFKVLPSSHSMQVQLRHSIDYSHNEFN